MARKRRSKLGRAPNATGRSQGVEQYANLSYDLMRFLARNVSPTAVKVFLELRTRFHGANNGKLVMSMDEAKRLLGLGKATVQRAFAELIDKGLAVCTEKGQWYGRRASTWAVTDKSVNGAPATNAWKSWRPNPATDRRRQKTKVGPVADPSLTTTVPPEDRGPVHGSATGPVRALRLVATVPLGDR